MKTFADEVVEFANDLARQQAHSTRIGMSVERAIMLPYFDAIFNAYRRALGDHKAIIPSPLHAAIANAQRFVGDLRQGMDEHKQVLGADAMAAEQHA